MTLNDSVASELAEELIRTLKLMQALRNHAPQLKHGVENSSYAVLLSLRPGPMRVSTIAELVHSDVSTISRQVATLTQHELLRKIPDAADGRASLVELTPLGEQTTQKLLQSRTDWLQQVLDGWAEPETETFISQLHRFNEALSHNIKTNTERKTS